MSAWFTASGWLARMLTGAALLWILAIVLGVLT